MHVLVMGLIMAVYTWGNIFMLAAMAFHTGHLTMFGLQGGKSGCLILMTSGTELYGNRITKDYIERTMGFMALQTIFQGHFRRMSFMAVKTGLILSLFQAVLRVTGITVLLGMSTGICRHLIQLVLMAACTGGAGIIGGRKINQQRMVGIVAGTTLVNGKMGIVISVMASGTFRNGIGAGRRMLFMALHTGEFFMGLTMGINVGHYRIMAFDTVCIGERQQLKITGLNGRFGSFFRRRDFRFSSSFSSTGSRFSDSGISSGRLSDSGIGGGSGIGIGGGSRFSRSGFDASSDLNSGGINGV